MAKAQRTCSVDGCNRSHYARGWCRAHYLTWWSQCTTCRIDGCNRPVKARGWCGVHWQRWYVHGDPIADRPPRDARAPECTVDGCSRHHEARGYCVPHYERWKRHGDPLGGGTTHGDPERHFRDVVLPYDGDDCLLWPFSRAGNGYAMLNGKVVSRLVCKEHRGPPPTNKHEAAHTCGKGSEGCVSRHHVRWATPIENAADKIGHGTSARGEQSWTAKITENDVREIRALTGLVLQRELAEKYNITQSTVSNVQTRRSWAWLD